MENLKKELDTTDVWLKPKVEVGGSGGSRSWRVISTLLLCSLLLNTIYIWKSVADVGGHRDEQRGLSQHQNYFNNLFGLLEWSWQGLMCHIRYTIYRVSSKTVPTWLFALFLASSYTNWKSWDVFEKFRKFAT